MSRHRRSRIAFAIAVAPLTLAAASPQNVRQQREEIQERLAAERLALRSLQEQKVGLLESLDFFQRRAHHSSEVAHHLKDRLRLLQRQISSVELEEAAARAALEEELTELAPRLSAWYRLTRHRRLEVALSASSFESLIWRASTMTSVVRQDLELLKRAKRVATFQRFALDELTMLKQLLATWLQAVSFEEASAQAQRLIFREMLSSLESEARRSTGFVRELERADSELGSLVNRLSRRPAVSAFGLLKGRLPYPTAGMIEVGFGKVINPKFNTLTVQKGVDIRAALGSPVLAVASGRVVYADWLRGYGNLLIVDHGGGYHTLMAHLDGFARSVGDEVRRGDELGRVGETGSIKGPYLYFEIRNNGQPIDPSAWLSEAER
jgi:septal ring factor EnvC (AmiA/AmiB activator)